MRDTWSFDPRRGVVRCGWNCNRSHEHFSGTYQAALNYFGVDQRDVSGYKKLKDIVVFHQLSDRTLTKTSSELYEILIEACSKPQYWVPEEDRHRVVMEVLESCKDSYLIKDDEILEKARRGESNRRGMQRLYRQEKWERTIKYKQ